jgi:putative ABC transport system ATP-binding protein
MQNMVLQLDRVSKVFHTEDVETHALMDVDFTVRKGEYVAISGPSGCGKSTLLSILGLLDTPTSGEYTLAGRPMTRLTPGQRADARSGHIGFIFQSFNLLGDLTAAQNVELPMVYRKIPFDERQRRVASALERVGMSHRAGHYPAQLSGGQQQRIAVARAVAGDPAILLADEPTGNLDSINGDAVMGLLADLHHSGSTICVVTHDPRYAQRADRVVEMFDGRLAGEVCAA